MKVRASRVKARFCNSTKPKLQIFMNKMNKNMKHQYISPLCEVVTMRQSSVLCASGTPAPTDPYIPVVPASGNVTAE